MLGYPREILITLTRQNYPTPDHNTNVKPFLSKLSESEITLDQQGYIKKMVESLELELAREDTGV